MKTYAFLNIKGGVGKTTSATTVAHILASEHKKRVLLIDLDAQANSSSLFSQKEINFAEALESVLRNGDLSPLKEYDYTVGDILTNPGIEPEKVIFKTQYDNLDLIPSFIDLSEIESALKNDMINPQQFKLRSFLERINQNYDYCIMDCSPAVNLININGLAATDYVFCPLNSDMWGFAGYCIAQGLVNSVRDYNFKLRDIKCFLTQFDNRTAISKQIRGILVNALKENFIDIQVRKCVRAEEIGYAHKALTDYAPNSTTAEDYRTLAKYIIENY